MVATLTVTATQLGALVVTIVICIGALVRLPQLWRGETSVTAGMGTWWPFGRAALRAWERALPLGVAAACALVIAAVLGWTMLATETMVAAAAFFVALATFLLLMLLMATVALVNRPKRDVPPHLRDQPGMLRESIRALRKRRRRAAAA